MKKIAVLGTGQVGDTLANGFLGRGDAVMRASAEVARPIEALCQLWCAPGFARNDWKHAFAWLTD